MADEYRVKGIPTEIKATSRVAIKIKENFYTIEATETRTLPAEDVNMDAEYAALFDSVNSTVDAQCNDILHTFNTPNKK